MRHIPQLLLLSFIAALTSRAQAQVLVKDLNLSANASPVSSIPHRFFRFGSRVFFAATTPEFGTELWSTDGTEAGTAQVADIAPGRESSYPSRLTLMNGKLLFNASGPRGEELWITDGSSIGTRPVADLNAGLKGKDPADRIVYHGQLLFATGDDTHGGELWITDETPAGTKRLKELITGPNGAMASSFVPLNDLVYFSAAGALWQTDGTESGTIQVKTVGVYDLIVVGSRLFFVGVTDAGTRHPSLSLWVSDGTEPGTRPLTDGSTYPRFGGRRRNITPLGGRILFPAFDPVHGEELWVSDGTAAGTHIVADLLPGPDSSITSDSFLAVIGNTAFFSAFTPNMGQELWKTDGTEAGTTLVDDIVPGATGSGPSDLTAVGGKVYFIASSEAGIQTLWVTDGTRAGTRQIKSATGSRITTGVTSPDSSIGELSPALTNIDGIVYFAGANALNGYELWKSDGTDAGTSMIANLAVDGTPSSDPHNLTAAGDWIYFDAWDGAGTTSFGDPLRSLWRSDGTPGGTLQLTGLPADRYVPDGRLLLFIKSGLWTSDGTPEGTVPATAFVSRFPGVPVIDFVQGDSIFASVQGGSASELWVTTTAPAAPAFPLGAPSGSGYTDLAGRVMYFASGGLWTTDGTSAGTYNVMPNFDFQKPVDSVKGVVAGGFFYFLTSSGGGLTTLWKSDGSNESTAVVKTLPTSVAILASAGRNVYFISGGQLWFSDGSETGTRVLPAALSGNTITGLGDGVVFASTDSAHGDELWGSDGTPAGTRLIRDIHSGAGSSNPSGLTNVDGLVYFTADDGLHGAEPWVTDGTPEGTKLLADIEPGLSGSDPGQYVKAGERLFFTASPSATGTELWTLPLSPIPRLAINDIRVAEGGSGTANARFTVTLSAASAESVTVKYATSDGSALAGSDYEAASGTLTLAAGETSKALDVQIHGDTVSQNNRRFFVTLSDPAGAALAKPAGFAIIEDDDQAADVALTLDFTTLSGVYVGVNATNTGPRTATNLKVTSTVTPANAVATACRICQVAGPILKPGDTVRAIDVSGFGQEYHTATVTAREHDPEPSNNSVAWISNGYMAMDALYLTPGSDANVWTLPVQNSSKVSIASSDPSVLSVPAAFNPGSKFTFAAHGVAPGTATIRLFTPTFTLATLTVDVVAPGTKPRWPAGLRVTWDSSSVPFDKPVIFTIKTVGTAPYSGAFATGIVTFTSNGKELARATLPPGGGTRAVPVYLPATGSQPITASYAGDANFLPLSTTSSVTVNRGAVTVTTSAERAGTSATIHVRVMGSPMAAPTGSITISEPGIIPATQVPLTALANGVAHADVTLTGVTPGTHTLVAVYSGDTYYNALTQNARLLEAHRRAAGR